MTMRDGNYFDADYFGHKTDVRKSNYGAIGGYKHETGAPTQFAQWVKDNFNAAGVEIPEIKTRLSSKAPRVLEIGCATGAAVQAMRAIGIRAYGLDISQYILDMAINEVRNFLFLGSMTDIPEQIITMAPFDAVVSKDVLEHATVACIDQILRDLGQLAPRQFHVVNTGEYPYQAWDGDETHNIRMPLVDWEQKAMALDLEIVFKRT